MLIVKFIILLFCGGAIYLSYAEKYKDGICKDFYFDTLNLAIIIICLISVYLIWMFISIKAFKIKKNKNNSSHRKYHINCKFYVHNNNVRKL